jgi:hypothetical protein
MIGCSGRQACLMASGAATERRKGKGETEGFWRGKGRGDYGS